MTSTEVTVYEAEDWYGEVPRQIWRIGLIGILLMSFALGGFGYWAFSAPLAAAVVSQGSFVATGHNKIVQHLEGGIIDEILVQEGDMVAEGESLIRLDTTASQTRMKELNLRLARLEAMGARLKAEYEYLETLRFPEHLLLRAAEDDTIRDILESQQVSFELSRNKLDNDIELVAANIRAQELRIWGYEEQRVSIQEQSKLLKEDLTSKSELFKQGLTRKTEINALQRAMVDGDGQIARLVAEIGESQSMINRYKKQILQTRHAYSQAALDELHVVQAEIDSIKEQLYHAEDVLERTSITAPVTGTVVRLHYHTSGGVIEGGRRIAEILPEDAPLIIETLVPRTEIDSVQLGQEASVRLVALNQRTTPILTGEVFYISADALPDASDQQNREVYLARIGLDPMELIRVEGFTPTPGMPAEILITTQERTFMQYLTKPIVDSMSRAFRED